MANQMFEVTQNRNVFFGNGSIAQVENIIKTVNASKVFVLTYSKEAPALKDVLDAIAKADASTYICDIVQDEPNLAIVDQLASLMTTNKCDAVLALGGGSILDAAKAAAMVATNGGTAEEYQMEGRPISKPSLPLIMVPTTAGTGSESTRTAVICNQKLDLKKSFYSNHMIAGTVILDPSVTTALPSHVTAFTGIDALSHGIESYVSLNANVYTKMYSLKAIELAGKSLLAAVKDGANIEARADMLYASYFAGVSLHAGIGLAHIIAQPLGGLFKIPHGEGCSIFLPYAMEFNLPNCVKEYCEIGRVLGLKLDGDTGENARLAIDKVREIIAAVGTATSIGPFVKKAGVEMDAAQLDKTVDFVAQATGHIKCNPRVIDSGVIKDVISRAM
ncbi:MAG: iron-containing alcohol dehydrogenase [Defluviitaleaceae bacterium]|nr:iron-containing alcohol dehydrogenase [Defluviitaleaceae bacterium]